MRIISANQSTKVSSRAITLPFLPWGELGLMLVFGLMLLMA